MISNLIYWMTERERIRLARAAGLPAPWSKDPIFNEWRFCNVNRQDDRETRWIYNNITVPTNKKEFVEYQWFNLMIARFFNWSPTLRAIGILTGASPMAYIRYRTMIDRRRETGEKIYTGAYMIRAGTGRDAQLPKEEYLWRRVFEPAWDAFFTTKRIPRACCAMWDAFFSGIFGMGPFMRNQIITDLKYTRDGLRYADRANFCLIGPGTMRGLNRILERPLNSQMIQPEAQRQLLLLREKLARTLLPGSIGDYINQDANNLANCLCEFDKYERVRLKQGTPRNRFKPSGNPLPL